MIVRLILFAVGLASTATALVARAGCNADNCLRALRASSNLPRASADCESQLFITVTPPTVIFIEYASVSETKTITVPTTLVNTIHDTLTTEVSVTATTTVDQIPSLLAKRTAFTLPTYASLCSNIARFSSACSCIGVTAQTVTAETASTTLTLSQTVTLSISALETVETAYTTLTDATVTETVTIKSTVYAEPTPDVSCNNQGLDIAYYPNPFILTGHDLYLALDPSHYKTVQPEHIATAPYLGLTYAQGQNPYGFALSSFTDRLTLNHRGYFFSPKAGLYKVVVFDADDFTAVWVGASAISGWTRENANIVTAWTLDYGLGSQTYTVQLLGNSYVPLRVMWANAGGNGGFGINIIGPDDTVYVQNGQVSNYLMRRSCDGIAPVYVHAFGSEN